MQSSKKTTYPPIQARISWKADSGLEDTPIVRLALSPAANNALHRVGIKTVGQIMDNWDRLTQMPAKATRGISGSRSSGLGDVKAKEIKACVFAFLCANAKVKLSINTEGCAR